MELNSKYEVGDPVWIVVWEVFPVCPTCGYRTRSIASAPKQIVVGPRVIRVVGVASNGAETYTFDLDQDYCYADVCDVFKSQQEAIAELERRNAGGRRR